MIRLFEMLQLVESDWRARFGLNPSSSTPRLSPQVSPEVPTAPGVPKPAPNARVNPAMDPNALMGQKDHKNISKNLNIRGTEVKTGRDLHGSITQPINDRDRELNRSGRQTREEDPGYFNPLMWLQGDIKGSPHKNKPDFTAIRILKAMQTNPSLFPSGEYSVRSILTNLGQLLRGVDPMEVKNALMHISQLPVDPPIRMVSKIAPTGGTQHMFVFNAPAEPEDVLSKMGGNLRPRAFKTAIDPEEDRKVLNPYGRSVSPATRGGRADTVGRMPSPETSPSGPVDKSPPSLQMINKLFDKFDSIYNSDGGDLTQARSLMSKLKEMIADAKNEIAAMQDTRNPADIAAWQDQLQGMEDYLADIPADFGLVDGEPVSDKKDTKRRRLPYEAPPIKVPMVDTGDDEDVEPAPKKEWKYYSS
jgi:hypothetical protein